MAPKKAKKISLNEFLGDSTLGSWADEMDSLPQAPALRSDDDQGRGGYGRRDDFMSSRSDRAAGPPREDLPLPTQPPYTAFVGNLAFDLTEAELGDFFNPLKTKSVKIIKDRDERPKGFGYVEFEDLDGLKEALARTGTSFSNRPVRVSVAEPPKERAGFGGGFDDDSKFDNPWRRDKPLQTDSTSRDSSRRRGFDAPDRERLPSVSEGANDWRSSGRPMRPAADTPAEAPPFRRKGSGFGAAEGGGAADKEEVWSRGANFKAAPSPSDDGGSRFGSLRGNRGDVTSPKDDEPNDWRSASRPRPGGPNSTSPNNSTPPTPQMGRRKLELLPRSNNPSVAPSPVSSPKFSPASAASTTSKSNPFGSAKPIDVTSREKEVEERLERDRGSAKERLSMSRTTSRTGTDRLTMSRTSSRTGTERVIERRARSPPTSAGSVAQSEDSAASTTPPPKAANAAIIRPSFSFANAAANKGLSKASEETEQAEETPDVPNGKEAD